MPSCQTFAEAPEYPGMAESFYYPDRNLLWGIQRRSLQELARVGLISLALLLCCWPVPGSGEVPCQDSSESARGSGTPESHLGKGYEYLQDNRLQEAAHEFDAALNLNPRLDRARFQLAVCLFGLGERERARNELLRLLRATGGDPGVLYYLGRLDLLEGNLDAAIRQLEQAAREPPFPDTPYYLGSAYLKKREFALAERWLHRASKLAPLDPRIPDQLARLYQMTGQRAEAEKAKAFAADLRKRSYEHTEQAVACTHALETRPFEEARNVCQRLFDPQDTAKLVNLGMTYGRYGHYTEALSPLRRAAELDPESYEVQYNLGLIYFQLKRYPEARVALEKAIELRPDFFVSNALLGATLFLLREDEAAFNALSHAHQLNPDHGETADLLSKAALSLAQGSFAQKNYADCLKYLRTAAELHPDNLAIRQRVDEVLALLKERGQIH